MITRRLIRQTEHQLIQHQGCIYSIEGRIPILISVPHGVKHKRGDAYCLGERNTLSLAFYVQQQTNCHLFCNLNKEEDPNYDERSNYKDKLVEYICKHHILFVIDLHGAALSRDFDLEVGTGYGRNINYSEAFVDILQTLANIYHYKLNIDHFFAASGNNTVSFDIHNQTSVPIVQIEVNRKHRDEKNTAMYASCLQLLVDYVLAISRLDGRDVPKTLCQEAQNTHLLYTACIPLELATCFDIQLGEYVELWSEKTIVEVKVDINRQADCLLLSKRVMEQLGKPNSVRIVPFNYQMVEIRRPNRELVDTETIYLSQNLYHDIGKYSAIEVLNVLTGTMASFKPVLYSGSTANVSNAVWLNYRQRKLLQFEIPISISNTCWFQMKQQLSEEQYCLLQRHYVEDMANHTMRLHISDASDYDRLHHLFYTDLSQCVIRGIQVPQAPSQSWVLTRLLGTKKVHLRVIRCNNADESLDAVRVSKMNLQALGIGENDLVQLEYMGKKIVVKCIVIEKDDQNLLQQINSLNNNEDLELSVCVPMHLCKSLDLFSYDVVVSLERDVKFIFWKNFYNQFVAIVGVFIAIFSIEFLTWWWQVAIFILLCPFILYSILTTERHKL